MFKKRILISTIIISGTVGFMTSRYIRSQKEDTDTSGEATIVITTTDGTVAETTVSFHEETTLLEAMDENFDIEIQDDLFVTAIEGYSQSPEDNTWWVFEANEEMVNVGANEYILIDEDVIEWELLAF